MSDPDLQRAAEDAIAALDELCECWRILRSGRSARETATVVGEVAGLSPALAMGLLAAELDPDDLADDPPRRRPRRRGVRPRSLRGTTGRGGVARRGARKRVSPDTHTKEH